METALTDDIYGGQDPRRLPTYSITEAARYLRLPKSTLRSWILGREYPFKDTSVFSEPLITPPGISTRVLSFEDLIQAHILKALRRVHRIPMKKLRNALALAEEEFGVRNLLLSDDLRTSAGELFLDRYGELINLSRSGQLAIKQILGAHLQRVEYDDRKSPLRFFPFLSSETIDERKVIVIDPKISFGKPIVAKKSISTAVIVLRIDAGESVSDLASDYDLDDRDIEDAILYERAA